MIVALCVLFVVAFGLLVRLVRTKPNNRTVDYTVVYTANGPVYNGQLWKR